MEHSLVSDYWQEKIEVVALVSIYDFRVLVNLGRFFSFLIHTQSVGLLGRGSSRRKAATYTWNNTYRINAYTDNHVSSGVGTHDPSVRAREDG
jgi:hypothetical protein